MTLDDLYEALHDVADGGNPLVVIAGEGEATHEISIDATQWDESQGPIVLRPENED